MLIVSALRFHNMVFGCNVFACKGALLPVWQFRIRLFVRFFKVISERP